MRKTWYRRKISGCRRSYWYFNGHKHDPLGTLAADGMAYFTRARVVGRNAIEPKV
jgi:hypothetical protein